MITQADLTPQVYLVGHATMSCGTLTNIHQKWTVKNLTRRARITSTSPPTAVGSVSGSSGVVDTGTISCGSDVGYRNALELL